MSKNKLLIRIEKFLEVDLSKLNDTDSIHILGIDSFKLIELIGILEEELNKEIDLEDALEMKISDLKKLIDEYEK